MQPHLRQVLTFSFGMVYDPFKISSAYEAAGSLILIVLLRFRGPFVLCI